MKNRLLFPIIFAFIFSSCSDFSGNEDAVEASLKPGPVTKKKKEESDPTRTYYDLNGITYGNNTFVAVGDDGTVRTSSDNGATWDNGTRGTTRDLYEIAYGNSTFVAVGQSGTHLYSRDDGATWDNGTWSSADDITGVAFGNNTFVGVSDNKYLTKSTDNGANWVQGCSGVSVYDVAFGNSKFVASGAKGAIQTSDNGSDPCSTGSSGTMTHTLYGITFGNNRFFSVGSSGKLIISADDGGTFADKTSPTTITLYSTVFGNDKFVAVGPYAVVVSDNVGDSAGITDETVDLNDVTFGNGVFVAVSDKDKIYRSTDDGDSWTKVYP